MNIYSEFLQNKYTNWYIQITTKAKLLSRSKIKDDGYYENHHIIPSSLGGSNDDENLVLLTAREHFICHYLLCKMFIPNSQCWYKMVKAFTMMKCQSVYQERYFNSHLYEYSRRHIGQVMRESQKGEGNSQFGTIWITNANTQDCRKIPKNELNSWQELGYIEKRIIDFDKHQTGIQLQQIKEQKKIKQQLKRKQQEQYNVQQLKRKQQEQYNVQQLYANFIESNLSLRKFAAIYYDRSHVSLFNLFKKHKFRTSSACAGD
jgi:hypothetical protein